MFIRNAWYVAAWADEIGETPLARRICNEPVVLFRDQQNRVPPRCSTCAAIAARRCTWGRSSRKACNAVTTGWFSTAPARCVRVPGQSVIRTVRACGAFPVVEQDAFLWIWMGDPARADVSTIVP